VLVEHLGRQEKIPEGRAGIEERRRGGEIRLHPIDKRRASWRSHRAPPHSDARAAGSMCVRLLVAERGTVASACP